MRSAADTLAFPARVDATRRYAGVSVSTSPAVAASMWSPAAGELGVVKPRITAVKPAHCGNFATRRLSEASP